MKTMKKCLLFLFLLGGVYQVSVGQCKNDYANQIAQKTAVSIVNQCTKSPNKLSVNVTDCKHEKHPDTTVMAWGIWTDITWSGKYSTLEYRIKLYIEVPEEAEAKCKQVKVYCLEYSDLLVHRCIDLSQTRPLEVETGKIRYFPFITFQIEQ